MSNTGGKQLPSTWMLKAIFDSISDKTPMSCAEHDFSLNLFFEKPPETLSDLKYIQAEISDSILPGAVITGWKENNATGFSLQIACGADGAELVIERLASPECLERVRNIGVTHLTHSHADIYATISGTSSANHQRTFDHTDIINGWKNKDVGAIKKHLVSSGDRDHLDPL